MQTVPTTSDIVEDLLRFRSERPADERRSNVRHPYSKLIELTPVDKQTLRPVGDPVTVIGKELSAGGIGFYHQAVIPHRYLLLPAPSWETQNWLLMRIRWCRFRQPGWYQSGGQFVRGITDLPELID